MVGHAHDRLVEIRAGDLQFSSDEAAILFNEVGSLNLKPDQVEALNRRAEGWIVGLNLAALSLKGQPVSETIIERFTGSNKFILDYLTEEVVETLPDVGDEIEIQVSPDELRMDYYRASGHGGQNVQKNDTAVRLTHLPTGIVVTCQNERSQVQNRETAMKILRARLYELERIRQEEEKAKLKGEHVEAGWGNQIRSYVLHPYNMVKDHRTNYETGNVQAVLDGRLDEFMEAFLRLTMNDRASGTGR